MATVTDERLAEIAEAEQQGIYQTLHADDGPAGERLAIYRELQKRREADHKATIMYWDWEDAEAGFDDLDDFFACTNADVSCVFRIEVAERRPAEYYTIIDAPDDEPNYRESTPDEIAFWKEQQEKRKSKFSSGEA